RLCCTASLPASCSPALNRCLTYALEKFLQVGQSHCGSIGLSSSSYLAFVACIIPPHVNIVAWRAFLDGMTQSKKSIPRHTPSIIFEGVPTPIKYLGLSAGI